MYITCLCEVWNITVHNWPNIHFPIVIYLQLYGFSGKVGQIFQVPTYCPLTLWTGVIRDFYY
jgi:hypothetical protein